MAPRSRRTTPGTTRGRSRTQAPCDTRYEAVTSLTLGNSDGNVQHLPPWDGDIYNHDSEKFTMTFPFPVYGVSFDYDMFPMPAAAIQRQLSDARSRLRHAA